MKIQKNPNVPATGRDPFDQPVQLGLDRVLSLLALGVGAAALALHQGPAMVALGLVAVVIGLMGLAFGNW